MTTAMALTDPPEIVTRFDGENYIKRTITDAHLRFLPGSRQVSALINHDGLGSDNLILESRGMDFSQYLAAVKSVLWAHDAAALPVAKVIDIIRGDGTITATAEFPPPGDSPTADEVYALIKHGAINSVSTGFDILDRTPIPGPRGGWRVTKSLLREFSFVTLGALDGATITARAARLLRSGKVLSAENEKALRTGHSLIRQGSDMIMAVCDAAGGDGQLEPDGEPAPDDAARRLRASDGEKPTGDYGPVSYADPGFQSDGKPRYPIDTVEHIKAAWSYLGQAKNAAQYTADQVAKIKAKIIAAWKEKIDPAGPPSARAEEDARRDRARVYQRREKARGMIGLPERQANARELRDRLRGPGDAL